MSSKPKTRFVVSCDGILRELLSIRERTNGDLVLMTRSVAQYELDGSLQPVIANRYSIHRSLKSATPGTTIKLTQKFESGEVVESAQFRKQHPQGVIPVLSKTYPDLRSETFRLDAKPKDRLVRVFQSEIGLPILFCVVLVTNSGFTPRLALDGLSIAMAQFTWFNVHLVCGFFPVPATNQGLSSHFITSAPRRNGGEIHQFDNVSEPLLIDDCRTLVLQQVSFLSHETRRQLQRHIFNDGKGMGDLMPDIDRLLRVHIAVPAGDVDEFERQGLRAFAPVLPFNN